MSTASATSAATSSSKFAQWRKARKLETQSRNVASRQIKGSRLVLRYITLIVVAILMVGPLLLHWQLSRRCSNKLESCEQSATRSSLPR